jgi:hypothetical protein
MTGRLSKSTSVTLHGKKKDVDADAKWRGNGRKGGTEKQKNGHSPEQKVPSIGDGLVAAAAPD